jgi:hypothetical protein
MLNRFGSFLRASLVLGVQSRKDGLPKVPGNIGNFSFSRFGIFPIKIGSFIP